MNMENQNNKTFKYKSKKFIDELNNRKPNDKIFSANRDLESLMAMRDRRAQKYGITISESFAEPVDNYTPLSTTYRDDRFFITHEQVAMSHKISFNKKPE